MAQVVNTLLLGDICFGVPGVHMGQVSSLVPVFRHDSSDVNDVRFSWSNMLQKLVVLVG